VLYALFCYQSEEALRTLTPEQDQAMMCELSAARERLSTKVKFGPVARLELTPTATTIRPARGRQESLVLDGPFAETKEQLLGFYVLECATLEEALDAARELEAPRVAAGLIGALEVRPVRMFDAGAAM
jgi:hypothetical protein